MSGGGGGGIDSGGSGASIPVWEFEEAITETVGGVSPSSNLAGKNAMEILGEQLIVYQAPSFSSFSQSGNNRYQVVGDEIQNLTFTWAFTNGGNVAANSVSIIDVTSGNVTIAEGVDPTLGTKAVTLASAIYKTTHNASHQFKIEAIDTEGTIFSSTYIFYWQIPLFYGKSANTTLTDVQLQALTQDLESDADLNVTYADSSPTPEYAYIAAPSTFTQIASGTDVGTGGGWAFVATPNDASYSLTNVNGLNYYELTFSVGTDNPQSITYNVYRSLNAFAGAKTVNYDD